MVVAVMIISRGAVIMEPGAPWAAFIRLSFKLGSNISRRESLLVVSALFIDGSHGFYFRLGELQCKR